MEPQQRTRRKALVIGLGLHSEAILTSICQMFEAQHQADKLATVWLPPYLPSTSTAESSEQHVRFPLQLDHETLNRLYYSESTRIWSGANWRRWGVYLANTRLLGKLAMQAYLPTLMADQISPALNTLAENSSPQILTYIVAHLHDPFASGALLDLVYLMEERVKTANMRVNGLLLLPGAIDDPLLRPGESLNTTRLYGATTYAALRELHFILSEDGIPIYRQNATNPTGTPFPPFYSGECFLMGGSSTSRGGTVNYQTHILPTIARWVYLQTTTPIADQVPAPLQYNSVVSTMSIAAFSKRELDNQETSDFVDTSTDALIAEALRRIIQPQRNEADTLQRTQEYLELPRDSELNSRQNLSISSVGILPTEATTSGGEARFNIFEAQYTQVAQQLLEAQSLQAQKLVERVEQVQQGLDPDRPDSLLYQFRNLADISLPMLQSNYNLIHRHISSTLNDYRTELEVQESNVALLQDTLRLARDRFRFASSKSQDTVFKWLYRFTASSIFLFLLFSGATLGWIIWAVIAIGIELLGQNLTERRQDMTQKVFVQAQQDLLNAQRNMINSRLINQYLYDLHYFLHNALTIVLPRSDDETIERPRVDHLIGHIPSLLDYHLQKRPDGQQPSDIIIPEDVWRDLAPELIQILWEGISNRAMPDNDGILQKIRLLIDKRYLLYNENTEIDYLNHQLNQTRSRASILLGLDVDRLSNLDREASTQVIGLVGWSDNVQHHLREKGHIVHALDNWSPNGTHQSSDQSTHRDVVVVNVRQRIPFFALNQIEQWYEEYYLCCTYEDNNEGKVMYRGMMHPTRTGIAGPDILERPGSLPYYSNLAMLITILIRWTENRGLWQHLARYLRVAFVPAGQIPINFDELCGALQTNATLLMFFVNGANREATASVPDLQDCAKIIAPFAKALEEKMPRASEQFAPWEVATLRGICSLDNHLAQTNLRLKETERAAAITLSKMIQLFEDHQALLRNLEQLGNE